MATRMRVVCSVFCLTVWAFAVSTDACVVNITFPTTEVTLDANSSPTEVRFEVVKRCKEPLEDYRLGITASEGKNPKMTGSVNGLCGMCWFGVKSEICDSESKEKRLSCHARDTFPRQPFRTWQIDFTDDSSSSSMIVYFNVLYPTILKKFYISNHEGSATVTMSQGDTAKFQCHGDWGNPPSAILLRGPQNNILKSQVLEPSSAPYFTFSQTHLSCSDSGQHRCEVKGTDQYRAVTLLVRCRMEFKEHDSSTEVTVQTGGDARISFEATTYTKDIGSCTLSTPAGKRIRCNSKRSDVTVSGSLPYVVIILKLTNVTEQDLGLWALTASNPTGYDTLVFHLSVTEFITTSTMKMETMTPVTRDFKPTDNAVDAACSEGPELMWTIVGTTMALLVLIIIVLIILIIRMWRKLSRAAGSPDASGPKPQPDTDEDYLEPVPWRVRRSGPCSSTEQDFVYSEVNPTTMIDAARVPAPGANRQQELYENLRMAEVGERSVYSSLGKHGTQAPPARVTAPSNKCLIQ